MADIVSIDDPRPMSMFSAAMIMDGEWEMAGYEPADERFIEAAQTLINTGAAWVMPGRVGRTCAALLDDGLCTRPDA